MTKVLGVIGARLNSSRLPGKHLLDLGGKPLIARIFERLEQIPELDAIVLATTADEYNRRLVEWAQHAGKEVFAFGGDVNDLVGRVDAIVKQHQPQVVVYFCGDSPLIEPVIVSRMINGLLAAPAAEVVELSFPDPARPTIHEGFMAWPVETWNRLVLLATEASDREHVGSSLKKAGELISVSVADDEIYSRIKHRISVDTASDYQFMAEVYRRWYQDHAENTIVSLAWVVDELQRDASLALINQQVHQKTVDERSVRVVLLTQCGEAVGLGHLRRSMVLARVFQDRFAAAVELLIVGSEVRLPALALLPHRFIAPDDFDATVLEAITATAPAAVVVDLAVAHLPGDIAALLRQLRQQQCVTVALDGLFELHELLDLIFVPSFYLAPETLAQLGEEKVTFGWDHYFIDPLLQPQRWQGGKQLLVMSGGSDHYGLGEMWPLMLDRVLPAETQVVWVQGPYAKAPTLPANPRLAWRIEQAPENLPQLMAQADYALTPYGVTLFELLKLGKPVVAYHPGGMQQVEISEFRKSGVAWLEITPGSAVAALVELMGDAPAARRLMARATERVGCCDGAFILATQVMGLIGER